MSADWWRDLGSKFEGLDPSLCLNMNIEEIDGVEVRRYWDTHVGDDLSRARFESWGTEIGSALKPPPGANPFDHFCYAFQEDQEKNNDDYRRRPRGKETVATEIVKIGEETKKEDRAGLAKWSKALLAAEGIINEAALKNIKRRKKVKAQRARINKEERRKKSRIAEKTVFYKAIEIAPKYGVPPQVIRAIKQAKYVVKTKRTTCTIPNAGAAAAAFCTRLATRARLEAETTEERKLEGKQNREKIGDKPSKSRYQDRDEIILRINKENLNVPIRETCLKIATALHDDEKKRGVIHPFPPAWEGKSPLKMLQSGSRSQRRKPIDLFRKVVKRKRIKKLRKRSLAD